MKAVGAASTRSPARARVTALRAAAALLAGIGLACSGDADLAGVQSGTDAEAAPPVRAQNVILVSIDTLRADRLEPYGYGRPTSPNLQALASRSIVFEQAQAQAPQTAPSHASLFTSEYPAAHGIVNVHGASTHVPTLPPGVRTVAEELASRGIETAAFVSGGNLTGRMDMDRGFDVWNERNEDFADRVDALIDWISVPGRGRFFALLHTYQVHAPYLPPPALAERFTDPEYSGELRERYERYVALPAEEAWAGAVGPDYWDGMLDFDEADVRFLSDLYDAEIAYTDAVLRRLLEFALAGPLGDQTAVIVLSDHGEEFADHGKYQHDQVYEELVRVPLLLRLPAPLERAGAVGRVETPVQLIDVAPTILELLGVRAPRNWMGRSLVPLLPGLGEPSKRSQGPRPRFSELVLEHGPKVYRSVTAEGWKYIRVEQEDIDKLWEFLFDLRRDPGERRNLADSDDPEARAWLEDLRRALASYVELNADRAAALGDPGSATLSDDQRALLDALGYAGG